MKNSMKNMKNSKLKEYIKNTWLKDFAFTSPTQYFLFNLRLMEYEKGELNEEEFVNAVEKDFKEHQRLVAFNSKHWRDSDEEYAIAYAKEFGE